MNRTDAHRANGQGRARGNDPAMSPALSAMVDELRAEPPPELRWEEIERRLLDRIARGEGGRHRPNLLAGALVKIAVFTAAAAALALLVNVGGSSHEGGAPRALEQTLIDAKRVARAPGLMGARGARDLFALRVGDAIETGSTPLAFARPGVLRFTLAPESRAVITAATPTGIGTVVALERGALRAEVTPRDPSEGVVEAFAVEIGRTRVTVRGTAFTVERVSEGVVVDVEHGTVTVGPARRAGALATMSLKGPARASFTLDGTRVASLAPGDGEPLRAWAIVAPPHDDAALAHEPPAPALALLAAREPELAQAPTPAAPHGEPHAAALSEPAPHAPATPPAQPAPRADDTRAIPDAQPADPPSAGAPEPAPQPPEPAPQPVVWLTRDSVKAGLDRCLKETYRARPTQVKVSITSTLRIAVNADGTVKSAAFSPPLAPEVQSCAGSVIAGRFKSGPQTLTLPVSFGP